MQGQERSFGSIVKHLVGERALEQVLGKGHLAAGKMQPGKRSNSAFVLLQPDQKLGSLLQPALLKAQFGESAQHIAAHLNAVRGEGT